MKIKVLSLILCGLMLMTTGCGDKEAQAYATKLIPVLDAYQEQLSLKIEAEKKFYNETADTYEAARKDNVSIQLLDERDQRTEDLANKLAAGGAAPLTLSQILGSLQDYSKVDFEATQTLLQDGLDTRSKYLSNLQSLEIEQDKVKALRDALGELAKSKSDFKKFKEAADAILQTDESITTLLCGDLQKQVKQLTTDKSNAANDEEKNKIDRQIKQANERIKTHQCN